jgi:DNA end-binding protein Ku
MATTLRYAYEVRDAKPYFEDIPPVKLPDEMVGLAEHILDTKAGHFDPSEFEDRYETAVVEMLKQKQAGMPPRKEAPTAPPATVVNLMDALRRSVEKERPAAAKKARAGERREGCECRYAFWKGLTESRLTEALSGGQPISRNCAFEGETTAFDGDERPP